MAFPGAGAVEIALQLRVPFMMLPIVALSCINPKTGIKRVKHHFLARFPLGTSFNVNHGDLFKNAIPDRLTDPLARLKRHRPDCAYCRCSNPAHDFSPGVMWAPHVTSDFSPDSNLRDARPVATARIVRYASLYLLSSRRRFFNSFPSATAATSSSSSSSNCCSFVLIYFNVDK